jgi:hypothetical protein
MVFNHVRFLMHRCGMSRVKVIKALKSMTHELIEKEIDERRRSPMPPIVLDRVAAELLADYKERHKHDGE